MLLKCFLIHHNHDCTVENFIFFKFASMAGPAALGGVFGAGWSGDWAKIGQDQKTLITPYVCFWPLLQSFISGWGTGHWVLSSRTFDIFLIFLNLIRS